VKVEIRETLSMKVVRVDILDKIGEIDYLFTTGEGASGKGELDFDRKGFNDPKVTRSYEAAADHFGVSVTDIFVMDQVHGVRVTSLLEKPGVKEMFGAVKTDGAVTRIPRLVLAILTADCVPILMADIRGGAVGAVHAGWRGTVEGISAAAVETMADSFDSKPEDIMAVLGPAIGPCCYGVGPEVETAVKDKLKSGVDYLTEAEGGRFMFDLIGLNRSLLCEAGVPDQNIFSVGLCTRCRGDLFCSYRREGPDTGRMMSAIMIR
jgi:YfiH family protein